MSVMLRSLSYPTIVLVVIIQANAVFGQEVFSYDPKSPFGPSKWDQLDIPNNECGGMAQSGINIPTTNTCDEYNAKYTFNPGNCTIKDLKFSISNHVVRVDFNATTCTPPSMIIPNVDAIFDVLQYHIHAGSDHTLDGNHFGADMHIVHRNRSGTNLAVLGLFIEPTNNMDTDVFDVLIKELQDISTKTKETCAKQTNVTTTNNRRRLGSSSTNQRALGTTNIYNPYIKVPNDSTMYYYSGSLTTPPCSEIVTWNVVDTPISVSVREYTQIINLILDYINPDTCIPASVSAPTGYTARPTQPLNGRTIIHKCPFSRTRKNSNSSNNDSNKKRKKRKNKNNKKNNRNDCK